MACHFTASPFADTSPLAATRSRSGITTLMIGTRETRSSQLPWSLSVANSTPRVREALVSNRHELPIVAAGVQVQLQDAEGVVVGGFDSGWRGAQRGVIGPAGAHDKGADSLRIVPDAIGILRDVALVVVIMAGEDDLCSCPLQHLPQHPRRLVVVVFAEAEAGMVPVGQGAGGGMRGQIGAQPLLLGGALVTAAHLRAVGVEDHDVPTPQLVAVVALLGIPRRRPEVAEVVGRLRSQVLVVANSGAGAVLVPAPTGG